MISPSTVVSATVFQMAVQLFLYVCMTVFRILVEKWQRIASVAHDKRYLPTFLLRYAALLIH